MTPSEMFDCLCYAATSQQVEITMATAAVYHDQLGGYDGKVIADSIRAWVAEYDEPYRRLPTVGELRAIIRRSQNCTWSTVKRDSYIIGAARQARKNGATRGEIEALVERLQNQMIVRE